MLRFVKLVCAAVCGLALLFAFLLGLFWLNLPAFAENRLRSMVAELLPEQPFRCTVRRIGLHGADLEAIVLGAPENPGLAIDSLRLDYSLSRLLARHVDRVAVAGLRLRGRVQEGQFVLEGFAPAEEREPPESLTPPLAVGLFTLEDGLLACALDGRWHELAFAGRLVQKDPQGIGDLTAPLLLDASLFAHGQEVRVQAVAALAEKQLRLALRAPDLALPRLADLAGVPVSAGRLRLAASAALALAPVQVHEASVQAAVEGLAAEVAGPPWRLTAPAVSELFLDFSGGAGHWRLQGGELAVRGPVLATLADFSAAGSFSAEEIQGSARMRLRLQDGLPAGLAAEVDVQGGWAREGPWRLALRARPGRDAAPDLALRYDSLALLAEQGGESASLHLTADLAGLRLRPGEGRELSLPALSLRGQGSRSPGGEGAMRIRAELRAGEGSFHDPVADLRLEGLAVHLPLVLPPAGTGRAGSLAVRDISLQGRQLGGLAGQLRQQGPGLLLDGEHRSRLVEGLRAAVRGEVSFPPQEEVRGRVAVTVAPRHFSALPLGRLAGLQQELSLAGRLGFTGAYRLAGRQGSGEAAFSLEEGELALPGKDLTVEGLRLALVLPELPALRSGPAQTARFTAARVGSFAFADGSFHFQLEPGPALFVEGGEVAWCGGRLHAQSLRIAPAQGEYAMTLFADRLNLAQVLAQFGVREAEGGGTLSGRIPFVVSKGRLTFEDAFLYSAPGEGGRIRIAGLGLLAAGVPRGTPQFAQLDFVDEALRDFQYNWARLRLISEEEELLVQMQLDGQPAQPIPFRYDGRLGSFARLAPGESGGIVHPVRLDMNLRLPLEKIMEYGGGIRKLLTP
jgi:hypothetical protein